MARPLRRAAGFELRVEEQLCSWCRLTGEELTPGISTQWGGGGGAGSGVGRGSLGSRPRRDVVTQSTGGGGDGMPH